MSINSEFVGQGINIRDIYDNGGDLQISVSANHRLEALRSLSTSILHEIDSLQQEERIPAASNIDLNIEVRRYEADLIRLALLRSGGKQRAAARLLNLNPTTLHEKIKRLGMHP
jgi:transcriptional regulator with GAF, ATPase, and Fis domain